MKPFFRGERAKRRPFSSFKPSMTGRNRAFWEKEKSERRGDFLSDFGFLRQRAVPNPLCCFAHQGFFFKAFLSV